MKKGLKQAIVAMGIMGSLGLVAGCGSNNTVGYIDMQKVVQNAPKAQELDKKIQARQMEIMEKLQTDAAKETPEQQQAEQMKLQQEFATFRQAQMQEWQNYVKSNAEKVAKEKKLSVVVPKEAVVSGGVDVTDDFLKAIGATEKPEAKADDKAKGDQAKGAQDKGDQKPADGQAKADGQK